MKTFAVEEKVFGLLPDYSFMFRIMAALPSTVSFRGMILTRHGYGASLLWVSHHFAAAF